MGSPHMYTLHMYTLHMCTLHVYTLHTPRVSRPSSTSAMHNETSSNASIGSSDKKTAAVAYSKAEKSQAHTRHHPVAAKTHRYDHCSGGHHAVLPTNTALPRVDWSAENMFCVVF